MIKGEKIRLDIHKILYTIYKSNKNFKYTSFEKIINRHKKEDTSLLNNVILNSMRYHIHIKKIINSHIEKKLRDHEYILLLSAITQIVFLDFRQYAVINCSVEIAKKLKIYHGLINAVLKKISKNVKKLKKTKIKFNDFPIWFRNEANTLSKDEKGKFIKNFNEEPNLHIVFKNKDKLINFEESLVKTSSLSGFLENRINITKMDSFNRGDWWVQDFSSFFPIHNFPKFYTNKNFLDTCAAPGGKAFQILSKKNNIVLNDKNKNRIKILKSNLKRLGFKAKILNQDFTNFKSEEKYDCILVDAPCSAVGTIRKNPEIFFKHNRPNLEELNLIQEKMLEKASQLLHKEGLILYMVCSFLKSETVDQIEKFLRKKSNFKLNDFKLNKENYNYQKIISRGFMITLPETILKFNIDGYFAAYLEKIR
tara:strand:+ start:1070 stop:2338 length:1269 start_codon:yes stop_codon:yes gene_type:complete